MRTHAYSSANHEIYVQTLHLRTPANAFIHTCTYTCAQMGLGKTVQTVAMIGYCKNKAHACLFVFLFFFCLCVCARFLNVFI